MSSQSWPRGRAWPSVSAQTRLLAPGGGGGAKRSCKGGIVAVIIVSASVSSDCISAAELLTSEGRGQRNMQRFSIFKEQKREKCV